MNKMTRGILLAFLAGSATAGEKEELETVRAALKTAVPQADPDSLTASPFSGMYEAVYGAQVLYISTCCQRISVRRGVPRW